MDTTAGKTKARSDAGFLHHGLRLDHFLLSHSVASRFVEAGVDGDVQRQGQRQRSRTGLDQAKLMKPKGYTRIDRPVTTAHWSQDKSEIVAATITLIGRPERFDDS